MNRSVRVLGLSALLFILVSAFTVTSYAQGPKDSPPANDKIDKITYVYFPDISGSARIAATASASSPTYKYAGVHWAKPSGPDNLGIRYRINPSNPYGVPKSSVIAAVDDAFKTWQNADTSRKLRFRDVGLTSSKGARKDGVNTVSFQNLAASYPGALAVTTVWYSSTTKQITEFDMVFNTAYKWSYTPPKVTSTSKYADATNHGVSGRYDIQAIATHEAGHTLQLDDLYNSSDAGLTMYGYGAPGSLKQDTLGYGDILGVNKIYR